MENLEIQILGMLEDDKIILHRIYFRWLDDHANLWVEIADLEKSGKQNAEENYLKPLTK